MAVPEDKIKGVIFGQAIGDALGLGAEFFSRNEVQRAYPEGLTSYGMIADRALRKVWKRGEWTDDTAQMLCILDSVISERKVNIHDIASRFRHWAKTDGRGMGQLTWKILFDPSFLEDPHATALKYWAKGGRNPAPNGALMRTSIVGLCEPDNPDKVIANTVAICMITHADPRCVASCVALTLAINMLATSDFDLSALLPTIIPAAEAYEGGVREVLVKVKTLTLEELRLDDLNCRGYTYKCLSAAFWPLFHASSFDEGLYAVINAGGDADTNGAVAGALLGARFGYASIPDHHVSGLVFRDKLAEKAKIMAGILEKEAC